MVIAFRPVECSEYRQSILRIGIVGCGRVAEHHMRFIMNTGAAKVAGLADVDKEKARRLGESYGVRNISDSLEGLLNSTTLDVLHILTPPAHHYDQTQTAINRGIHVLIEKPVTLYAHEAEDLYARAAARGILLCPDLLQLFHPTFQQAQSIVNSGQLGRLVHVESHLSENLDSSELREGVGLHWSYKLPGSVLHNYITHPLYLAMYWTGMLKRVIVSARSYGTLPHRKRLQITLTLCWRAIPVPPPFCCRSSPSQSLAIIFNCSARRALFLSILIHQLS